MSMYSVQHKQAIIYIAPQQRDPRRRIMKNVKVGFDDREDAVDAIMCNVSNSGALLDFSGDLDVPDMITVYNELDGYKIAAQVIRRTGNQVGIQFTTPPEVSGIIKSKVPDMSAENSHAKPESLHHDPNVQQVCDRRRRVKPRKVFGQLVRNASSR